MAMAWLNTTQQSQNQRAGMPKGVRKGRGTGDSGAGSGGPPSSLLSALAEKLRADLERFDILARRELEAMRRQHQTICEKAGIPEMCATNSSQTVLLERQRQILGVIEQAGARR